MQATHPAVDKLTEQIDTDTLERMTSFRLTDAIREGASVTPQAFGTFTDGNNACALMAGYISAKARGYIS